MKIDWLKQIPDDHLLEVAEGALASLADAMREFRTAKLSLTTNKDNDFSKKRFGEARKLLCERLEKYQPMAVELRGRGLDFKG